MNSVIIVGGGIIGLLTANELNKAGLKVTLIDRQPFGQESSWAGGGILSPLFPWRYPDEITRLARLSQQIYSNTIEPMKRKTGLDPEYLPSGMLILGNYEEEKPLHWALKHQVRMEALDNHRIQKLAPEVNPDFEHALWMPNVYQVRNPKLLALVKAYLATTDITLIENQQVDEIIVEDMQVKGVKTRHKTFLADSTVIASGAWSSSLLPNNITGLGVKPIRGQMLLLKGPPFKVRHITLSKDRYIIPRKDGHVLIGSTTEDAGFNKDTTHSIQEELLEFAYSTIPALQNYTLEHHWSGLRPRHDSGIPLIGRHPEIKHLYMNTGHYHNGLVLAPASARILCQIMLNTPTTLAETDYAPCDANHNKN